MKTPLESFWSRVDKDGPIPEHNEALGRCWTWTGHKRKGYGVFYDSNQRRYVIASRWILGQTSGPLNHVQMACHKCDNPSCVRPDHLYAGSAAENMRDCVTRGRYRNQNTDKTHCPKGHPLSGENLRTNKYSKYVFRVCKIFQREHLRNFRSKNSKKPILNFPEIIERHHIAQNAAPGKPPPTPVGSASGPANHVNLMY